MGVKLAAEVRGLVLLVAVRFFRWQPQEE